MNQRPPHLGPTGVRRAKAYRRTLLIAAAALGAAGAAAYAQVTNPPAPTTGGTTGGAGEANQVSLWSLFMQSFDLFTVLLVLGSLIAWTVIIMCVIEIRRKNIVPDESEQIIRKLTKGGLWSDLRDFVSEDDAYVSRVVRAALASPVDDKDAVREAAELAASEESARWFRKIEPLNVIGNLGPLLGLAGTVYGMVLAFAALGQAGGQANPASLSEGISKALFHTLLGLMLALPALAFFGHYRTVVDKLCTRAMVVSAELVELLPAEARIRRGDLPPGRA
ncbi:MAG: MotA/TolQ/ExbB proton channel family protein, partial [Phycisphaerales bacterium]|nr:MotA/TolQ/ExbB proton channel family protein [Phycisphaerales bacterium]